LQERLDIIKNIISELYLEEVTVEGAQMNKQTIKKLTRLANDLDKKGFYKEADEVDRITEKLDGNDKKLKRGRAQQLKSPMKEIIAFLIEEGYDGPEIDLPWDGGQITVFAGKDDHRIREVELKFIPGGEYVDYDHVAVEIHEWPSSTYKGPPVRGYVKNLEDFKKLYSKPEEYGWKTSAQRYQERMERIRKERESWQKNKRSWCPRCKGEGYAGPYGDTCSHCEGSGTDPRLDYTDEEVDRLKSRGNKQTIQKLARLANELDKKGFYKEADEVDNVVRGFGGEELGEGFPENTSPEEKARCLSELKYAVEALDKVIARLYGSGLSDRQPFANIITELSSAAEITDNFLKEESGRLK